MSGLKRDAVRRMVAESCGRVPSLAKTTSHSHDKEPPMETSTPLVSEMGSFFGKVHGLGCGD